MLKQNSHRGTNTMILLKPWCDPATRKAPIAVTLSTSPSPGHRVDPSRATHHHLCYWNRILARQGRQYSRSRGLWGGPSLDIGSCLDDLTGFLHGARRQRWECESAGSRAGVPDHPCESAWRGICCGAWPSTEPPVPVFHLKREDEYIQLGETFKIRMRDGFAETMWWTAIWKRRSTTHGRGGWIWAMQTRSRARRRSRRRAGWGSCWAGIRGSIGGGWKSICLVACIVSTEYQTALLNHIIVLAEINVYSEIGNGNVQYNSWLIQLRNLCDLDQVIEWQKHYIAYIICFLAVPFILYLASLEDMTEDNCLSPNYLALTRPFFRTSCVYKKRVI